MYSCENSADFTDTSTEFTDAGFFFEGTEKVLECWFEKSKDEKVSLRNISEESLKNMLKFANCTILSKVKSKFADAYVLSESSLFVYDSSIRLKTCGTTTLLHVLAPLLKLVKKECGFRKLTGMWYSRMSMQRPDLQIGMHKSFGEEVGFLDEKLSNNKHKNTGAAYVFGRLNGDHWNLYSLDTEIVDEPELTFEILMRDLDPVVMKKYFYCEEETLEGRKTAGRKCTIDSGLWEIVKDCEKVDETMFTPCGFSLNALVDQSHVSIHVTPQPEFSYASFETTVPYKDYVALINKLLKIFGPKRFLVDIVTCDSHRPPPINVEGFRRKDWVTYAFDSYELAMGHFQKG